MRSILVTTAVFLAAALAVHAQSAHVSGSVIDSNRGLVKGCEIVMRNTGT